MRDLKYLSFFENLLQEANNALITQAKNEGKVCAAFVCENEPRPARARDRGRIQLCRLRHRAGRLHDDEPLRREHGAA